MAVISGSQIFLPVLIANICSPDNLWNHRFLVKNKFFQILRSGLNLPYFFKFKDVQIILFSL